MKAALVMLLAFAFVLALYRYLRHRERAAWDALSKGEQRDAVTRAVRL